MKNRTSKLVSLLPMLVFALFALCLMQVLLTGAGVYKRLVEAGETRYAQQTAARYLATRVRQAETVEVVDFEGCEALCFPQTIEEEDYVTLVYHYEGYLWELFTFRDAALSPEDGEKLLKAEKLDISLETGLLTLDTGADTIVLALRTGREAIP